MASQETIEITIETIELGLETIYAEVSKRLTPEELRLEVEEIVNEFCDYEGLNLEGFDY